MTNEYNMKLDFHGLTKLMNSEYHFLTDTQEYELHKDFDEDSLIVYEYTSNLLEISKELRKGKYKGITVGEIDKIDDIIAHIMNGAMAGNLEAVISRLDGMLLKYVKEPDPKLGDLATMATDEPEGEEDILDIEPEDALELEPDEEETV